MGGTTEILSYDELKDKHNKLVTVAKGLIEKNTGLINNLSLMEKLNTALKAEIDKRDKMIADLQEASSKKEIVETSSRSMTEQPAAEPEIRSLEKLQELTVLYDVIQQIWSHNLIIDVKNNTQNTKNFYYVNALDLNNILADTDKELFMDKLAGLVCDTNEKTGKIYFNFTQEGKSIRIVRFRKAAFDYIKGDVINE